VTRRRLAAVFAHPDDDAFGMAGTCALHADDADVLVVFATSGDGGRIADPSLATRETLGGVREGEAAAAYAVLGAEAQLLFLRHPDGGVSDVSHARLVEEVEDALAAFAPEVVITFGPEGVTGHADHVTVGRIATEAFERLRERTGGALPARLLHVALAQRDLHRLSEELRSRGLEPPDPNEPFQPRGVPDERIGVRVDCSSVVHRKLAALREHRTQAQDLEEVPQDLWPDILATEAFVVAWPAASDPDPVLSDVFEGLPPA
jgi:LmbE family N-acetylglucosaminyl deacetylase